MKRALFIDRDGTLILEPPVDYQVDSLAKLEYLPAVFRNLYFINKNLPFEFIMVSNQDGMGREQYPEASYLEVQEKIITAFANEGVSFDAIHIDSSMPEDNLPTRKPGTGMLEGYMKGDYDLERSWVIGDRITDIELAKNLGTGGILIGNAVTEEDLEKAGLKGNCGLIAGDWTEVYHFLLKQERRSVIERNTSETNIRIDLSLDGTGQSEISSGIGFFDHMLEQIARHSGIDLNISVKGDLKVDEHHTIEDTGLALGQAFSDALGDRKGISRYAFVLPMDDADAQVSIDMGGRNWLVWDVDFKREMVGEVPTEMIEHFFKSFSDTARCNLNIQAKGKNEHHKIEAIFKAFAKVVGEATRRDPDKSNIPSTKGSL